MPQTSAVDAPRLQIERLLAERPHILRNVVEQVEAQLHDVLQSVPPPRGVLANRRASAATFEWLEQAYARARDFVKLEVRTDLRISRYQWLFYLRRLPVEIFAGELKTTYGYDSLLAEVITGDAPVATAVTPTQSSGQISFPITENLVSRALWLAMWAIQLSDFHSAIRWTSKNVEFAFPSRGLPRSNPSEAISEAVAIYDRRNEGNDNPFFGRLGTYVGTALADIAASRSESSKYLIGVAPIEEQIVPVPQYRVPRSRQIRVPARYAAFPVPTTELAAFCRRPELADSQWPDSLACLLQLLSIAGVLFLRRPEWLSNLMQRGYVVGRQDQLWELFDELIPYINKGLRTDFPHLAFSTSTEQFLALLSSIRGLDRPLAAGPVVRPAGEGLTCLDFWAATSRLNHDFQVRMPGGKGANIRADHFENAVQEAIDRSHWRPSPKTRQLRKALRRSGRTVTDIDAVGEHRGSLLIVSCKSILYTPDYDAGDFGVIRNAASTIVQGIRALDDLNRHPIGDNYDLTEFRETITVVCTPHPIYVPPGPALLYVTGDLRRACTLLELQTWTKTGRTVRVGASPRPRQRGGSKRRGSKKGGRQK